MARTMPDTIALFDLPEDVQLDLFAAEPAEPEQAPVWVRVCDHVGCILTSKHRHGTVTRTGSYCSPDGVESGTITY